MSKRRPFGGFDRDELDAIADDDLFNRTGTLTGNDLADAMSKLEKHATSDDTKRAVQSIGKSAFSLWWNVMPTPVKVVAIVGAALGLGIAGLIITALVKFVAG